MQIDTDKVDIDKLKANAEALRASGLPPERVRGGFREVDRRLNHWNESQNGNGLKPNYHQAEAVYEVLEKGNGRALIEHTTGSGKTFLTAQIKGGLEKKLGRPARVVVLSPEQALRTAWSEEELNLYADALNLDKQRRVHITGRSAMSDIRGYDFLGLNYHKLGYIDPDESPNPYFDFLQELFRNPRLRPDIIALDEAQNLKTPRSNRTRWLEQLSADTKGSDTLWLSLSAYAVPNRLEDAGVPLHFLDPEHFPLAKYHYRENPHAIKDMRQQGKWLTFTREDLKALLGLPELTDNPVYLEMDDEHVRRYLDLWKNGDMSLAKKLYGLKRIAIDASYDGLRERVGDIFSTPVGRDSQVLIFTDLKTGILPRLYDVLRPLTPDGSDVAVVDGDSPFEERVQAAKRFRDGKTKIQVNTEVMSEGIPMNTQGPCYIIYVRPTSVPGSRYQGIGRVDRRNQTKPVYVNELVVQSSQLAELMRATVPELEAQYHVRFPATWTPTTIPQDERSMRLSKEQIYNDKVKQGLGITDVEESLMNTDEANITDSEHSQHLTSIPPVSPQHILKRVAIGFAKQAGLYGAGSTEIAEAVEGRGAYAESQRTLVDIYSHPDRFLPQAKIAYMVDRVVKHLEKSRGEIFRDILDIGCGSGTIAYELDRPVTNLDIDPRMLRIAQQFLRDKDGMRYVQGDATRSPFSRDAFDLVLASNSLMYLAQRPENGEFRHEVEEALLGINGTLRNGGSLIATLPHRQTTDEIFDNFNKLLESYGFKVKYADLYRMYRTGEQKRTVEQRTYLTVADKAYDASNMAPPSYLTMYVPTEHMVVGGTSRYSMREMSPRNGHKDAHFVIIGRRSGLTEF